LPLNFANIDPKFLTASPKNGQIVDNLSSPQSPKFRKEATVAELISGYFCIIYLIIKGLCSFSEVKQTHLKSADLPKSFQKPASKNLHC
jgi:hypothetical protein